jgi:predicted RNA-binding Zn-ribbon protein involved in translation (DUF1610 family)
MKKTSSPAKMRKRTQFKCVRCGDKIAKGRKALNYKTCLKCGEEAAGREMKKKFESTAPLYNKGGYMYITPGLDPKSIGRKAG